MWFSSAVIKHHTVISTKIRCLWNCLCGVGFSFACLLLFFFFLLLLFVFVFVFIIIVYSSCFLSGWLAWAYVFYCYCCLYKLHRCKMAPVNGDVKWRCVIVCAILSVLLFERTVCVYTRMIVRTCCTSCRQWIVSTDPNSCTFPTTTHKHKRAHFSPRLNSGVHANGVGVRVCWHDFDVAVSALLSLPLCLQTHDR